MREYTMQDFFEHMIREVRKRIRTNDKYLSMSQVESIVEYKMDAMAEKLVDILLEDEK